jgi:hypothetical protein
MTIHRAFHMISAKLKVLPSSPRKRTNYRQYMRGVEKLISQARLNPSLIFIGMVVESNPASHQFVPTLRDV